jgi:membrane-bound inhibitor of C-type lysozyme
MISRRGPILLCAVAVALGATGAAAQSSFQTFECADGTPFVVAFYRFDPNAHIHIDGKAIALRKRLAVRGDRYASQGVDLRISKQGAVRIKHAHRPWTDCREVKQ